MDAFALNVLLAAAGVAVVHTLLGADHYLPFIMLSKARSWTPARALAVTAACGVGHVLSSVALGAVGVALGAAAWRLEAIEGWRGDLAAWAMVAFGAAYALWGLRHALRRRRGYEVHDHAHGHGRAHLVHVHRHGAHAHDHAAPAPRPADRVTFWTLFAVFVLGPCEPLIPLFVLPASRGRWALATATAAVFAVVTIASMVAAVAAGVLGIRRLRVGPLERWSHSLAGSVIAGSGLAVIFLGI